MLGGMTDAEGRPGRRHGAEGLLKYTEAQTVSVQRLLRFAPLPGMSNERYADLLTGAVRVLNRFR